MGKDGQPKHRQAARELLRRKAQRQPAERVLIVCEGSKTEPLYLGEIRQQLRLPSANVQVQPAAYGTEPLRIIEYAERLFTNGQGSHWAATCENLGVATGRARALVTAGHTAEEGAQPYTNMHELVYRLLHLKDQAA